MNKNINVVHKKFFITLAVLLVLCPTQSKNRIGSSAIIILIVFGGGFCAGKSASAQSILSYLDALAKEKGDKIWHLKDGSVFELKKMQEYVEHQKRLKFVFWDSKDSTSQQTPVKH